MTQLDLTRTILGLSSGTLAGLTAETNSTQLDAIRRAWLEWLATTDRPFASWQAAWHAYQASRDDDDFAKRLATIESTINRLETERVAANTEVYALTTTGDVERATAARHRAEDAHTQLRKAMTKRGALLKQGFEAARLKRDA